MITKPSALILLTGIAWIANAEALINEHFDENVPDNSPIGGAPGWHAYALFGGVVTDFTSSTPNGNYPTLSHLPVGAGNGGIGYLVMGAGNVVSNVLVWVDSTTNLNGFTITNLSFYTKNNAAASTEQIVVRIGGQWYASTKTFSDNTGNNSWAPTNFVFTTAASAWQTLNTNTLTLGAVLGSPLPSANVTAVGAFGLISGTGKIRFDEFVVSGTSSSAAPWVAQPTASPASTVSAPASVTLTVSATGSAPLAYHWRKGRTNLNDGATGSGSTLSGSLTNTLVIANTSTADSGDYDVVVTNNYAAATSTVLVLTVSAAAGLVITEHFDESTVDPGVISQAPGWHALAKSGEVVTDYSSNPNPPAGNTYPNLSLSASADGNGVGYLVMGQNDVVNPVLVWMDTAAALHTYTVDSLAFYSRNNSAASTMQIAVLIGANWYLSTTSFTDATGGATPWAAHTFGFTTSAAAWQTFNTNTLNAGSALTNALPTGDVLALGIFGTIASDVTGKIRLDEFRVNASPATAPPVVATPVAQPGTNVFAGTTVTLSVAASGAPTLAYQWRKNGVNLTNGPTLTGATGNPLTLTNVTSADAGSYDVVVRNDFGTNTSPPLFLTVSVPRPVSVDLSAYDASGAVAVSKPDTNTLMAVWSDKGGAQYRVQFNLNSGQVLFRSLETAPSGSAFSTVAQNVDAKYRVTIGARHAQIGWPYIFFDNVDANTPPPVACLSSLNLSNVCVISESQHRVRIVFSTLAVGPYSGDLTCYVYDGSPFVQLQASMLVTQPWVAYIYDALFYANFANVTYKDKNGAFQRVSAASLTQTVPGEAAKVVAKHRTITGTVTGGSGTLAVVATPHTCVYPTDQSDNYGYLQAGKTFIGTKMSYSADNRYRPWVDAPNGSNQRMDAFLLISTNNPQATLTNALAYTHGDSYKPVPGHYTMAEHFHPEFTWNDLGGGNTLTPFKQTMQSIGVQILQPMEFHGPGHPFNNTSNRLVELDDMFRLFEANSDGTFLLIPGEEYNNWFGGHWSYMFPRRVYFTGWPGQDSLAYKQTNVVSGGVTYPTVYQVGDSTHMMQLLQDEGGIAWSSHPRIKDSQQKPDSLMNSDFYRDGSYQAGDWKAMPLDLSKDRLGFRSFQLMDDTAQWGYQKSMLGEVDTFGLDLTHEIYAHMNVNYLELPAFPSKTNWSSVVDCVRNGQFFTTTGEILIYSWNATTTGVTATVEWYFPPAFAEITWGDAGGVHKQKLSLADRVEFSTQQITIPADLTTANWVRLEVWDVARNGAFTQLYWYHPPANPTTVVGEVMSFTLIDADTDAVMPAYDPIPNQAVLERSKLPANLTIRANISPLVMDSVTIGLDGASASRTQWPYCLTACAVNAGLRGCPFYDYAASVLNTGSHIITATPWRGTNAGTPLSLSFSVVDSITPPSTNFVMDGVMDSAGYQIGANGSLYAAVKGTTLYVAAPATDGNDQFIFITDTPGSLGVAPWGKAGQVAFDVNAKPYLAQNGATRAVSWSNGGAAALCPASVSFGWMEGTIDLAQVFGTVPPTLSIALARYTAGSGGVLIPSSQIPAGNGNGTVEAAEFLVVPVSTIRDDDFDGVLDVLESDPAFAASFSKNPGVFVIRWPAVPGQTYQVISCDDLQQSMLPLSGSIFAGERAFSLSYTDQPPQVVSQRFYRVENLTQH